MLNHKKEFLSSFKITFVALIFLLSPFLVSAVIPPDCVDYSRSLPGDFIPSPVNFDLTFEDTACLVDIAGVGPDIRLWGIVVSAPNDPLVNYFSEMYSTSTLTGIFSMELPFDEYNYVRVYTKKVGEEFKYIGDYLEYNAGDTIFEVGYHYLPVLSEFPADVLAYAGELFTDLSLVIILAIGLPLAFWIIKKIISLVRTRQNVKP